MISNRHCETAVHSVPTCPPVAWRKQSVCRDCFVATLLAMTVVLKVTSVFAEAPVSKDAIAFSRLTNGYWQIWTVAPNGDNLIQRTTSLKDKRNPVWKPGEDKILYHTSDNELFLYDLTAQEEAQLLPGLGRIGDASFTPDGRKLIFTRFDENVKDTSNLWLYDFDTKGKTLLTQDPGLQYSPDVSPDGTKVVYVAGKGWGTHEIWVLNLESSATQRSSAAPKAKLADPSSRQTEGGQAGGKEKKRLTENESYDVTPEFSADGTKVAYASNLMGNYDIWLMDSDGKNQRKITKPIGMETSPTWSPKGDRLAIASQRKGNLQIWLMDPQGKEWKQLTFGDEEAREPAWRR